MNIPNGKPGKVIKFIDGSPRWVYPLTQEDIFSHLSSIEFCIQNVDVMTEPIKTRLIKYVADIRQYILDVDKNPSFDKFDVYG